MPNNNSEQKPGLPAVSVIIPAYNTAGHIGAALHSVFAQSFTDFEVIVINDGSPDSEALELAIAPYLPRIVYLKQQNKGPSAARNFGIQRARGEFLAFLDSDDTWLPQYLAEQLKFQHTDPSVDMVYCDAVLDGGTRWAGKTFMQLFPSSGPVTFESLLVEQTQVITSGTLVRRKIVLDVGLFDEEIRCSEDHDLWLRILHSGGKIAYQRQVLLRRYERADSQGSAPGSLLAGEIQSLSKLSQNLDLTPQMRALIAERLQTIKAARAFVECNQLMQAGEFDKARESLARAYALAPTPKLGVLLLGLRIAPRLTMLIVRLRRRWQS
jgi:GT2 family glycosyltransferase